ncbi:translation initiation factor IF-2-like isoform X1 [Dermochelys coriacea]|uniref:translation initiation factor IF-2-like isoform X1 n=1 Tax=Dermochelys coriacea TaxID=27794 RepID=UPI001CA85CED|nr:translation initiation factor IF-2-like isoform X1 [Dermochelys coriacea]
MAKEKRHTQRTWRGKEESEPTAAAPARRTLRGGRTDNAQPPLAQLPPAPEGGGCFPRAGRLLPAPAPGPGPWLPLLSPSPSRGGGGSPQGAPQPSSPPPAGTSPEPGTLLGAGAAARRLPHAVTLPASATEQDAAGARSAGAATGTSAHPRLLFAPSSGLLCAAHRSFLFSGRNKNGSSCCHACERSHVSSSGEHSSLFRMSSSWTGFSAWWRESIASWVKLGIYIVHD